MENIAPRMSGYGWIGTVVWPAVSVRRMAILPIRWKASDGRRRSSRVRCRIETMRGKPDESRSDHGAAFSEAEKRRCWKVSRTQFVFDVASSLSEEKGCLMGRVYRDDIEKLKQDVRGGVREEQEKRRRVLREQTAGGDRITGFHGRTQHHQLCNAHFFYFLHLHPSSSLPLAVVWIGRNGQDGSPNLYFFN